MDTVMAVGLAHIMRDKARKTPLADGCDHDLRDLPIIDMMADRQCTKCHGIVSEFKVHP